MKTRWKLKILLAMVKLIANFVSYGIVSGDRVQENFNKINKDYK